MALTFGFYNSLDGDRRYDAVQISQIFDGIINDGVFQSIGDFFATKPSSGLSVTVGTGRAWFDHTWTLNDALIPLTVDAADPTLTRIDAVVLEVDSSKLVRANSIKIVKGTAASAPTKPAMTNTDTLHQHPLAYITVKPGMTEVKASEIEIMVGKSECPFVTAILETTDIDAVFAQWESQFETWFENVQSQLEGDIATNLQRQIDKRVKISDKASESDGQSGTNDSKWMTPKSTKAAIGVFANLDNVYRIGDIMLSNRPNPRAGFVLANGEAIDSQEYPDIADVLGVTRVEVGSRISDTPVSANANVGLYQIPSNGKFVYAEVTSSKLNLHRKIKNYEVPYPAGSIEWTLASSLSMESNMFLRDALELGNQFAMLLSGDHGKHACIVSISDLVTFKNPVIKHSFTDQVYNMMEADNLCYILTVTSRNAIQIGYSAVDQLTSWQYVSLGEKTPLDRDPAWMRIDRNLLVFYIPTGETRRMRVKTFNLDSRTVTATKTYELPSDFNSTHGIQGAFTKDGHKCAVLCEGQTTETPFAYDYFFLLDDVSDSGNTNFTMIDPNLQHSIFIKPFVFDRGDIRYMGIYRAVSNSTFLLSRFDLNGAFEFSILACTVIDFGNALVLNGNDVYMAARFSNKYPVVCRLCTDLPNISITGTRAYIKVKNE